MTASKTNLSDAPAEDLTVILGQFQPTDFAFFRIGEVALGTLEPGAELASQPLVGTILSDELASYNGLGLYVVRTAGGRADAPIEDFYLSDYFADLSGAGATYESAFEAQAVRFFFDGDDDGVSDYNAERFGAYNDDRAAPWTVTVAAFVDEEARAITRRPRTRIDHLIAHSNNIFAESGVKGRVELSLYSEVGSSQGRPISDARGLDVLDTLIAFQAPFQSAEAAFNDSRSDLIVAFARSSEAEAFCGVAPGAGSADGNLFGPALPPSLKAHFFVVGINCPDSVFAHELGHVGGLGHSRRQEELGARSFALGHGLDARFTTIMPYGSVYADASEISLFSNPNLLACEGEACGVARSTPFQAADAAFTLNQTLPHLAAI
ncbi:MAG: hypothetical protein EBS68_16470, partial [Rhodobacteraceae bacterium]|nr:hypothetical protein [Paracoccaceae bacterium]